MSNLLYNCLILYLISSNSCFLLNFNCFSDLCFPTCRNSADTVFVDPENNLGFSAAPLGLLMSRNFADFLESSLPSLCLLRKNIYSYLSFSLFILRAACLGELMVRAESSFFGFTRRWTFCSLGLFILILLLTVSL